MNPFQLQLSGVDKIQVDGKTTYSNDEGNISAPADYNGIAWGRGESRGLLQKGGRPVPGKTGEPPSGVDRSFLEV